MVRIFNHYIPKALLLLGLIEVLALFFSLQLGVELRFGGDVISSTHLTNIPLEYKAGVFTVVLMLMLMAMGLYQRHQRDSFRMLMLRMAWTYVLSLPLLLTVFYLFPEVYVGRGAFALTIAVSFVLLGIIRFFYQQFASASILSRRVLVVGSGKLAQALERLRRRSDWHGTTLIGFLHLRGDHDEVEAERLIRSEKPIAEVCADYGADEIVIAVEDNRKNFPTEEIIDCKLRGIQITELASFFEQRTGKIHIDAWSPGRMLFLDGFDNNIFRVMTKRLFDIVMASIALILALPVMMLLVVIVRHESRWRDPSIYKQVRTGQHGQPFTLYKFRSMVVDAEKNGAVWASKNDPRVTRVGAFMRKTRLDELPQLWNVLKGDMSFVGPRPERPEFVEQLSHKIPYYAMRHRVKPGITGWAQVNYPYGDSEADTREKLQYDLYYIKNYSLFLDLTILVQTAEVVLWRKGSR
ncbi:TIGR03013 family PEP-CTERM/XrtA system glycosyltransferase [Permianibacter sp. IMCC34836]|uniref:TIGR03013 family XrtA/PEP-CTERM system glycosyltransferase n=1 Tax=Permianibacter fluminis TaxID=2738515 RepID=UPI00155629F1|nr:TIGR03013 family XrtA/PEP-CTERM system glycosyltransferase [Permianibacter fluminis]NQD37558.1 TIGR03013 family PEP-CTERM/XrtA system glycosyltransferase [Permianibacter fluminis]